MDADYFRMLFDYNREANGWVLEKASKASEADYHAESLGLSFGSLHATLVHQLVAEVIWLARWRGGQPPSELANPRESREIASKVWPTFVALRNAWREHDQTLRTYMKSLSDEDVDAPLAYRMSNGDPFVQPLRELIAHALMHGMQFRTEAAVRLSQLDLSPGDLDLIVYLRNRR